MSVRAFELVPAIERVNLLSEKASTQVCFLYTNLISFPWETSGYTTMVHGRGCNPHRSMTTFANLEITSLWRHWWRH